MTTKRVLHKIQKGRVGSEENMCKMAGKNKQLQDVIENVKTTTNERM